MTRARFKALITEYGWVAMLTYLVLFALVLVGFILAISFGFNVKSSYGQAGVFGAAYLATKATQPLRIGATLLLTPIVARVGEKWRARRRVDSPAAPSAPDDSSPK
jgi:hypothetical protein